MNSSTSLILYLQTSATPDPPTWVSNLSLALGIALILTVPLARLLLAQYRRRVLKLMQTGPPVSDPPAPSDGPSAPSSGSLEVRVVDAPVLPSDDAALLVSRMVGGAWKTAAAYGLAGLALCFGTAWLWLFWDPQDAVTLLPLLVMTILFAGFTIPTVSMVAVAQRWQVWVAPIPYVLLLLLATPIVIDSPDTPYDLLIVAAIVVGAPTLLSLGVAGPSARAAGPTIFLPLTLALMGIALGIQSAVNFLTAAPFNESLPTAGLRLALLGGVGITLAAACLTALVRAYAAKRLGEQELRVATWWLIFTCVALFVGAPSGHSWTAILLPMWAASCWLGRVLAAHYSPVTNEQPPPILLVLRVFRSRRRLEALMRGVEIHWRYAGPIYLIGGPDLASKYVDPLRLMGFLQRRLAGSFLSTSAKVDEQIAHADQRADPDGRYRVNEFFCTNDTWRYAVTRLMSSVDVVLADFRGFTTANEGSSYELRELLDRVPLDKLVCLVDRAADTEGLSYIATQHWPRVAPDSPNRSARTACLTLVTVTGGREVDAKALLGRLAVAACA